MKLFIHSARRQGLPYRTSRQDQVWSRPTSIHIDNTSSIIASTNEMRPFLCRIPLAPRGSPHQAGVWHDDMVEKEMKWWPSWKLSHNDDFKQNLAQVYSLSTDSKHIPTVALFAPFLSALTTDGQDICRRLPILPKRQYAARTRSCA